MNTLRTLIAGVVGGLRHFVIVGGLYVYLYGPELFGYSTTTASFFRVEPFTVFIILGAFVLGAVPAALLVERRLVTPALAVIAFVAAIILTSTQGREPQWKDAGPSVFAFYFVLWVVSLFVACVLSRVERLVRYLLRRSPPDDAPAVGP